MTSVTCEGRFHSPLPGQVTLARGNASTTASGFMHERAAHGEPQCSCTDLTRPAEAAEVAAAARPTGARRHRLRRSRRPRRVAARHVDDIAEGRRRRQRLHAGEAAASRSKRARGRRDAGRWPARRSCRMRSSQRVSSRSSVGDGLGFGPAVRPEKLAMVEQRRGRCSERGACADLRERIRNAMSRNQMAPSCTARKAAPRSSRRARRPRRRTGSPLPISSNRASSASPQSKRRELHLVRARTRPHQGRPRRGPARPGGAHRQPRRVSRRGWCRR